MKEVERLRKGSLAIRSGFFRRELFWELCFGRERGESRFIFILGLVKVI